MAKRTYKVLVGNFKPPDQDELVPEGGTFTVSGPLPYEQALLDAGTLSLDTKSDKTTEKFACPRCVEEGMKRPPRFEEYAELEAHYSDKHGGLVPPAREEVTGG